MRNVHSREMAAPIERVRPWIEASWTGTARDPFPRDVLRTWRKNPPGEDPLALLPGVTRVGHGFFSFLFESWDGARWRVRVESPDFRGWHGFDLEATPTACRVTHTIELELSVRGRFLWRTFIAPIHDWCVEAMLDRIEEALRSGEVPATTRRGMPWPAATSFAVLRRVRRRRDEGPRRRDETANAGKSL
jgi:hypothetical protein